MAVIFRPKHASLIGNTRNRSITKRVPEPELMSTGLTFGTISATYGYTAGIVTRA